MKDFTLYPNHSSPLSCIGMHIVSDPPPLNYAHCFIVNHMHTIIICNCYPSQNAL